MEISAKLPVMFGIGVIPGIEGMQPPQGQPPQQPPQPAPRSKVGVSFNWCTALYWNINLDNLSVSKDGPMSYVSHMCLLALRVCVFAFLVV